jgi:erythromycin esterase-like protein/protein-L-isoaspartate O-methyltransferase
LDGSVTEVAMRDARRELMVEAQLAGRGIADPAVLAAMGAVSRESYLPNELVEEAWDDAAIVVAPGRLLPQPWLLARALEALEPHPGDRVLELDADTDYSAAVLRLLVREVVTLPPTEEGAPFDAILVHDRTEDAAVRILPWLREGGRLVVVVPEGPGERQLIRFRRRAGAVYDRNPLERGRFVLLPWGAEAPPGLGRSLPGWSPPGTAAAARLVREVAEPFGAITDFDPGSILERVGDARLVLIGEASHGTAEFYSLRARLTRALIEHRGFGFVAVEADWPDAAEVDRYVRHRPPDRSIEPFARFPTWMWRNREVAEFVDWLHRWNADRDGPDGRVGFHGLDLYSLHTSLRLVLDYLDRIDPEAAHLARERYGCLRPWELSPAAYGRYALTGSYRSCEEGVVRQLTALLRRRLRYGADDGERFFDAEQNARLVADAERYYRAMYYGAVESWNLRDRHMFATLDRLLASYGPSSRGIVWAHNSHLGDASATELGERGELNLGQLCRAAFGEGAYLIGFGTDRGTVAAASDWDGPLEIKAVRPAHPGSYESVCRAADRPAFGIHLRAPRRPEVRDELLPLRLERAIGVVYRPETELQSHYFAASLPRQFDEYLWVTETSAVGPLPVTERFPPVSRDLQPPAASLRTWEDG